MKKHHIITIIISLVYVIHRFLMHSPISYLNDVACIPVIAGISLMCLNLIFKNIYRLSIYQVAFIVIYVSVMFEFILPRFDDRVTADLIDVFCYQIGGLAYYILINPKELRTSM